MDEHTAATRIQASFRGRRTRSQLIADGVIPAGGYRLSRPGWGESRPSSSPLELDDDSRAGEFDPRSDAAATRIQATYRGHLVRKSLRQEPRAYVSNAQDDSVSSDVRDRTHESQVTRVRQIEEKRLREEHAANQPQPGFAGFERKMAARAATIEEQERERAAARIQAVYRGHQVRRSLRDSVVNRTAVTQTKAAGRVQKAYAENMASRYSTTVLPHTTHQYNDAHAPYDLHHVVASDNVAELPAGTHTQISSAPLHKTTSVAAPSEPQSHTSDWGQNSYNAPPLYENHAAQEALDEALFLRLMATNGGLGSPSIPDDHSRLTEAMRKREDEERVRLRRDTAAATKIQAAYRGHRDRRNYRALRTSRGLDDAREAAIAKAIQIDAAQRERGECNHGTSEASVNPPDRFLREEESYSSAEDARHAAAATQIQAVYRGHRVRNSVNLSRASVVRPTIQRSVDTKLATVHEQKTMRANHVATSRLNESRPRMTVVANEEGLVLKEKDAAPFVPQIGPASAPKPKNRATGRVHVTKKHKDIGKKLVTDDMGNLAPDRRPPPPRTQHRKMSVGSFKTNGKKFRPQNTEPEPEYSPSPEPESAQRDTSPDGPEFWPSGHRRIAYDGGIIPDPTLWRDEEKKAPPAKNAEERLSYFREKASPQPPEKRHPPVPKGSYLEYHKARSSYERTAMSVNLVKLFKESPSFHPDAMRDVTKDARKLANKLGVKFEPGESNEEDYLRYKYVHDYVWKDAPDPEHLAESAPTVEHVEKRVHRSQKGKWRLPLSYPEAGSKDTKNYVNVREVLPAIDEAPQRRPSQYRSNTSSGALNESTRSKRFLGDDAGEMLSEIQLLEAELGIRAPARTSPSRRQAQRSSPKRGRPGKPRTLPPMGEGFDELMETRPPEMVGGARGMPIYAVKPSTDGYALGKTYLDSSRRKKHQKAPWNGNHHRSEQKI